MTPPNFPEFARLWKEQIDPTEQATLHALAKTIERTAKRRRIFDFSVGLYAIGGVTLLLPYPAVPIRLASALIIAVLVWLIWKRQQIAKAAHAIAAGEPAAFFAAAIKNARDELSLSRIGLWGVGPMVLFFLVISLAARSGIGIDLVFKEWVGLHIGKKIFLTAGTALVYLFAIRAHLRLREQLRRLEDMSREYEEEDVRDLKEGS